VSLKLWLVLGVLELPVCRGYEVEEYEAEINVLEYVKRKRKRFGSEMSSRWKDESNLLLVAVALSDDNHMRARTLNRRQTSLHNTIALSDDNSTVICFRQQ
jgi:hypothetical protein